MATISMSRAKDQHDVSPDPVITTLMTRRVVAVGPSTALLDALRVMNSAGVRHLPVIDGARCVGLLTEIDMLRHLVVYGLVRPESTTRLTAGQVCRRPAPIVPAQATRAAAAEVMLALGSDAVLVLNNNHVLGIVTVSDLAASLAEPAFTARTGMAPQQSPVPDSPPETSS